MDPDEPKTDKIITVSLPPLPYPILIGGGTRRRFAEFFNLHARGRAFWITDRNVADAWGEDLGGLCSRSASDIIIMPPGEERKTFATVERICQILVEMGAERGDTLVACGGGVVGDIVGFAAAIYKRGVAFVQVPTTLLAMVDASIGGKTGVDLPQGKNLLGVFHQPRFVLTDTDFLTTLDDREFKAGYAEVLKTVLISDADLFTRLDGEVQRRFFAKEPDTLVEIIAACAAFKAKIVEEDEKEEGLRRILNFGHTVGHALEVLGEYARLKHGEALFWGISAAVDLSEITGLMRPAEAHRIQQALVPFLHNLPRLSFRDQDILPLIGRDKKVAGGTPHFILLETVGKPVVTKQVTDDQVLKMLDRLRRRMNQDY